MSDPPTASPDHQPITNVADDGDIILTLDDKSRLRVQSQSLIIASPVFRAMLDGRFKEGQQPRDAVTPLDLELKGDDPNALSRLCHILQHKTVSPKLSSPGTQLLQELVAITEVADKYGCCAAISPQMESILWRFLASSAFKRLSLADAKNLAAVSYFIDHAGTFYVLTRALILEYHKPFTTRKGHHGVVHLSTEICLRLEDQRNAARLQLHGDIPSLSFHITEACEACGRLVSEPGFLANLAQKVLGKSSWCPRLRSRSLRPLLSKLREVGDVDAASPSSDCTWEIHPRVEGRDFKGFVGTLVESLGLCLKCVKREDVEKCTHRDDWEDFVEMLWL